MSLYNTDAEDIPGYDYPPNYIEPGLDDPFNSGRSPAATNMSDFYTPVDENQSPFYSTIVDLLPRSGDERQPHPPFPLSDPDEIQDERNQLWPLPHASNGSNHMDDFRGNGY